MYVQHMDLTPQGMRLIRNEIHLLPAVKIMKTIYFWKKKRFGIIKNFQKKISINYHVESSPLGENGIVWINVFLIVIYIRARAGRLFRSREFVSTALNF